MLINSFYNLTMDKSKLICLQQWIIVIGKKSKITAVRKEFLMEALYITRPPNIVPPQ